MYSDRILGETAGVSKSYSSPFDGGPVGLFKKFRRRVGSGGYRPKPTAISYFDKLKTKTPSKILAPRGNHKAGKKLVVRWRTAPKTKYYEFQFFQGRKRVIKQVIDGTSYTLNANLLKPRAAKYRVVVKRSIGKKKKFAKKVWGGKSFKVVKPKKKK